MSRFCLNHCALNSLILLAALASILMCQTANAQYGNYSNSSFIKYQLRADSSRVNQWFSAYDQIRRQSQMSPQERQKADYFLSKITAFFVPGQEKLEARDLLTKMVNRYRQATMSIKQLPLIQETEPLQRGYYKYFVTAGNLFIDYLKVQDNLLAVDASGQPIAAQLFERKQNLEALNEQIQGLDQQLRNQFGIQPYQYQ